MDDAEDEKQESEDDETDPVGRKPWPVTPKMLIKALKLLRKTSLKGLFHSPREVTSMVLSEFPDVEQDFLLLFMEVSDKLACAAAAGMIECKEDVGYCAHDMRQKAMREDSRPELMFWILYKRLLKQKSEPQPPSKEKEDESKEREKRQRFCDTNNSRYRPYSLRHRRKL